MLMLQALVVDLALLKQYFALMQMESPLAQKISLCLICLTTVWVASTCLRQSQLVLQQQLALAVHRAFNRAIEQMVSQGIGWLQYIQASIPHYCLQSQLQSQQPGSGNLTRFSRVAYSCTVGRKWGR